MSESTAGDCAHDQIGLGTYVAGEIAKSDAFFFLYPPTLGTCAAGQMPVYRVYSNRADANHRYTTSRAVRDQMVGIGWLAEGDGPDTVVMCAPG